MKLFGRAIALFLIATFVAPSPALAAESHSAVDDGLLDRALLERVGEEERARESLRELLVRPEVAELAGAAGLDLRQAGSALETLDVEELRDLAERARQLDGELSGGTTVTISLVTLLLIIIIVILLAD